MNFHISVSVIFASNLKANREIDKNYPGLLLKTSEEQNSTVRDWNGQEKFLIKNVLQ